MIGRPRLDDAKAACNLIKIKRKYDNTNLIHKCISTPFIIDDINITNRSTINYNTSTGNISIGAHGIAYKKICICPTTNQKLRCTNQHAIDILNKHRNLLKRINK